MVMCDEACMVTYGQSPHRLIFNHAAMRIKKFTTPFIFYFKVLSLMGVQYSNYL
jgi:hypothetical protein